MRQKRRVVVGALSARGYRQRREACCSTWIKPIPGIELVFLIGKPELRNPWRVGDILYLPCPDSYDHLSIKTKLFCQWALTHYDFDYLFKCDDDTYVDLERLLAVPLGKTYVGADIGGFASGGAGYLLSTGAAIVAAQRVVDPICCEDLMVGRALNKAGIVVEHSGDFNPGNEYGPLPDNTAITSHYCDPVTMRQRHALRYPQGDQ